MGTHSNLNQNGWKKNKTEKGDSKCINLFSEIRSKKSIKQEPSLRLDDYIMNLANPIYSSTNRSQKVKKINFNDNYLHKEYNSNMHNGNQSNFNNNTNTNYGNAKDNSTTIQKKCYHRRTVSDNPTYGTFKKFGILPVKLKISRQQQIWGWESQFGLWRQQQDHGLHQPAYSE